jgi:hypothetical protein
VVRAQESKKDKAMNNGTELSIAAAVISGLAAAISALALYWSHKSWKETYRPLITLKVRIVRYEDNKANVSLEVNNTGNRPAINIDINVDYSALAQHLGDSTDPLHKAIKQVMSKRVVVLPNDKRHFAESDVFEVKEGGLKQPIFINAQLKFLGLDGRSYGYDHPVILEYRK